MIHRNCIFSLNLGEKGDAGPSGAPGPNGFPGPDVKIHYGFVILNKIKWVLFTCRVFLVEMVTTVMQVVKVNLVN